MTSESVSSVLVDLLNNNRKVGRALVSLYRRGGTELLERSLPGALGNRAQHVKELLQSVIGRASDSADIALDKVYDTTAKAVVKVATRVDDFADQYAPKSINIARQLTLPGAQLARHVSATVAATAGRVHPIRAQQTPAKPTHKATKRRCGRK